MRIDNGKMKRMKLTDFNVPLLDSGFGMDPRTAIFHGF